MNEDCFMNCQELDYSENYDLEFAWMRVCRDTCTEEETCFMEWSADNWDYYATCEDFYTWMFPSDDTDSC